MDANPASRRRIVSLDQFRGYTVAGMLFVNFLGGYQVVPAIFKHHNTYCSYADTIMPQFFFAVGFAYRLTFLRRLAASGFWTAVRAVLKRNAGLILLGFVIYHLDGEVKSWAELQQAGRSGFPLPGISPRALPDFGPHRDHVDLGLAGHRGGDRASGRLHDRLGGAASLAVVAVLFRLGLEAPVIDGGPLGFLTWTIPTLVGSLAYDAMVEQPR